MPQWAGGADIFLEAAALKEASPGLEVGDKVRYAEETDERKGKKRALSADKQKKLDKARQGLASGCNLRCKYMV